jgi:heat-inducible transcriptional repressor
MTERQEALLASIINEYVETAEPVSSKLLERDGSFGVSSATIRAEMNELERLGYLVQLHTSSGRVPTEKAYRHFVDNLTEESYDLPMEYKRRISRTINDAGDDPREINKAVAQVLSALSDNLVITGVPEKDDFFKIGLSGLFEMPEFREFEKAFRLTSFFDEFEEMFRLIEKEFSGQDEVSFIKNWEEGIKVLIGGENQIGNIRDETLMFTRYNLPHEFSGSLTLIGPIRMDYCKNIGLMKYTTEELNKIAKNL